MLTQIPSVLSFEKKLVPSDAYFYAVKWENRNDKQQGNALHLKSKTIRGTISNRLKSNDTESMTKANIQEINYCQLPRGYDTLKVSFNIKVLGNLDKPSACNLECFLEKYQAVIKEYIQDYKFKELAHRYAVNIANGRFLWRNRFAAEQVEVHVVIRNKENDEKNKDENLIVFNAFNYSLDSFDNSDKEEISKLENLSSHIANALAGKSCLLISINAYVMMGEGQEVYPSQKFILDVIQKKNNAKKLYSVGDGDDSVAAMHSQKIGNALRTIDTWYGDNPLFPIAVEPYGSVTNLAKAFRVPENKNDFYTLFDKYIIEGKLDTPEQKHFVVATLIRGGVFGLSKKRDYSMRLVI